MCLIVNKLHKTKSQLKKTASSPKLATRDFKVKKLFIFSMSSGILTSPYQKAKYTQNATNINEGFDWVCLTSKQAYECMNMMIAESHIPKGFYLGITRGIHSYKNTKGGNEFLEDKVQKLKEKNKLRGSQIYVVIECTIPKDTFYYENGIEIASTQIFVPPFIVGQESKNCYNTSKHWKLDF